MPTYTRPRRSALFRQGVALLWLAVFTFILPLPAHVEAQRTYDPHEVALLPPYCKHTQLFRDAIPGANNPTEIERWTRVLGNTFIHLHHYCWGLMATNHALFSSRTREDRIYSLNDSIREFDYVIERAPSNFVLLPEILTKKGENLIRLGSGPQGLLQLERAIELKPDYWPPYAYISDYYKELGQVAQAREWLEKGLSVAPNTKPLMRRLAQLNAAQTRRSSVPSSER